MSDKNQPVVYAVAPSAGRRTRFLPITKSMPKEMLPVVDRPSIEHIVREAADAGVEDTLFITCAGKQLTGGYFNAESGFEVDLEKAGKEKALEYVNKYKKHACVHSVRQGHPFGFGYAILQAKSHVGGAPCAVLLPNDLMEPGSQLLRKIIQVRGASGGTIVALLKVTPEQVIAYALAAVKVLPAPEGVDLEEGQLMRIADVTEKPPLEEVKSECAVVGRYLFDPTVLTAFENIEPSADGEYRLTDGYARMIDLPEEEGGGLYDVVTDERRFNTRDKPGHLGVNVTLALEDPALEAEFKELLCSKLED